MPPVRQRFLCSFLAAFTAIELSRLFVKKTRFDLFLCPLTGFLCGELINLLLETPLSYFIQEFGNCVIGEHSNSLSLWG